MALKLVTGPAAEPVSVSEAKSHLRVDLADDDTLIGNYITAARQWCEAFTRRALVTQTWDLTFDYWPTYEIRLPLPPLQSVTSISYTDQDGSTSTFSSSNYFVDTTGEPGRIVLKSFATWPSVVLREAAGVTVRFVAGYGNAATVPQAIKSAMLLVVGTLYENREDVVAGQGVTLGRLPFGVDALLWPWRALD